VDAIDIWKSLQMSNSVIRPKESDVYVYKEQWKESIIVPIYKKVIKQIAVIIEAYHFCHPYTKLYPTSFCQG
jgi:hypothetical protein